MFVSKDTKELSNLYERITEAKELDLAMYGNPPPRAKFQTGDFVTIRDEGRFQSYHTKRHTPYINKAGEVVGYFNYPGAFTKYTVKFSDGVILPIHSNFLIGPFKSMAIAREYEDVDKEVVPEDIKFPVNRPALENWETKPAFESVIRSILTQEPYNYHWHDQPIEMSREDGKVVFELARLGPLLYVSRENKINNRRLTTGASGGYRVHIQEDYTKELFGTWYGGALSVTPEYIPYNCIVTLSELKKLQTPVAKQNYILSREIDRAGKLNNELLLKLLQPYLESNGDGYRVIVPENQTFSYNPVILKNCSVLDNMTIVGDARVTHGNSPHLQTNKTLVRSPHKVEGDLRLSFSPNSFEGVPTVTGEMSFYSQTDRKTYVKHLAGSSYEEHEDMFNF